MPGIAELINTFWIGSIYFLSAVALTISYRITTVLNFAHMNLMTIGAYVVVLMSLTGPVHIGLAVPVVFIVGALTAMCFHAGVYSPLMKRGASPLVLMISSMGIWIFLKYVIYGVLGYLQDVWRRELYLAKPKVIVGGEVKFAGLMLSGDLFAALLMATIVGFLLYLFFSKTKTGRALRAVADNPNLAEVSGISKERVMYITWFIAGGLASLSGMMWGLFAHVTPELGDALILQLFAASVIGGLYSVPLTTVGAYTIAGAENIVMSLLHKTIGLEVSFRPFLAFFILLIVILIRPPLGAGGGLPYRFKWFRRLRGK